MSKPDPRSDVFLDVEASTRARPNDTSSPRPRAEDPFRIAILGDFSGRASRGVRRAADELAALAPVRVDRDDIDAVLARLRPRLRIPTAAADLPALEVEYGSLDDFHPDRLYERLPLFDELRELRRLAGDPGRYRQDAQDAPARPPASSSSGPAPETGTPPVGGLLDRIMEETPGGSAAAGAGGAVTGDLGRLLESAVTGHKVASTSARQAEMLGQIDTFAADQLRTLLHHPHVRGLESLWRGLEAVAMRVETAANLQLFVVDITRDEVEDELERAARGDASGLLRLLTAPAEMPGDVPWSLLVGCYAFRPGQARLLARIGAAARDAGAPFIARAAPELAGAGPFEGTADPARWSEREDPEWTALRHSAEARWLGLALPRFLLRLPYGQDGEPTDVVTVEEAGMPPRNGDYLWGNPALLCAILLARSFAAEGWAMRPERTLDLDRLPLHIAETVNGPVAQPCAEALMTDRAAVRLLELGFMPVASFRDQDRVKLVRFQSIAEPVAALRGRWG